MQKDTAAIENFLKSQPHVSAAAVETRISTDGNKDCIAFVTLDQVTEKHTAAAEKEKVRQWAKVYDISYSKNAEEIDPEFNTAIWTSNYSGDPIPEVEMKEWVASTVKRILELNPASPTAPKVLEIGCGTGLLLYSLLPHVSEYVGIDNSEEAIQLIQRTCNGKKNASNVKLVIADADDLSALPPNQYDIIVINSVAQYFPSVEYLIAVIAGLKPFISLSTTVFIGDVNCFPLLEAFQAETQLTKAAPDTSFEKLNISINKLKKTNGRETFFDPRIFHLLPKRLKWIHSTETRLRQGHFYNEMNNFRFDVILKCGIATNGKAHSTDATQLDWEKDALTLEKLITRLNAGTSEQISIHNIPNARTQRSAKLLDVLKAGNSTETVAQLKVKLDKEIATNPGIKPETFWNLKNANYQLEVDWDYQHWNGKMSVHCRKKNSIPFIYPTENFLISESSNRPAIINIQSDMNSKLAEYINKMEPVGLRPKEVFIISPEMYSLFKNG